MLQLAVAWGKLTTLCTKLVRAATVEPQQWRILSLLSYSLSPRDEPPLLRYGLVPFDGVVDRNLSKI